MSIHFLLSHHCGIVPAVRRRSPLILKLAEQEDIFGAGRVQRQCWGESTAAKETGKDYPLLATIPVAESVENQFDPCRHSKFFEDPIDVVPSRMLISYKPQSTWASR